MNAVFVQIKPLAYDPCDHCAFCDACPLAHFFPFGYHKCGDMRDMRDMRKEAK